MLLQSSERCGKPRERIISKSYLPTRLKTRLVTDKTGTDQDPYRSLHLGDISKYESKVIYQHGGWTKCDCGAQFLPGIVLDPFLGSGTTAVVAERLGRRFIGIEVSKKYCEIAAKRIKKEVQQKKLNLVNLRIRAVSSLRQLLSQEA